MTEEKQKETKVNFSFLGALKFWLAFLLVALIGTLIVLALMAVTFAIFIQPILLDMIENIQQVPTLIVSFA